MSHVNYCDIMKKLILILPLLLIMLSVYGQTEIEYFYDNAGNRISKEIVLSQNSPQSRNSEKSSYSDKLLEYTIKIYPNPTKGNLQIDILGVNNDTEGDIGLYNVKGRQIGKVKVNGGKIYFDLTAQPAGIYILIIRIEDKSTSWKIVKE